MAPDASAVLRLTEVLAALAVVQGTLELLARRSALADGGTWRWSTLARELRGMSPVLAYRPFVAVLVLRLAAAVLLLAGVRGAVAPLLWVTSLLVNLRFRGTTNGGSDMMLMVVLSALVVAHLGADSDLLVRAALLYVAAQGVLSYFVAGVAKLGSAAWRDGTAIPRFLATPHFGVPAALRQSLDAPGRHRLAAWGTIVFECVVPLALLAPQAMVAYVAVAALFHAANAWAFGLNRFLLVWSATWPAMVFASSLIA
jgi:Vitamin K-dependent gamma-carboxylase